MHMMAHWKYNFINFNVEGCSVHFLFWRKNKKNVEDKAATMDGIEVGDDDMTKDWNHGLMMIRKS
jgi:hypothetical protein